MSQRLKGLQTRLLKEVKESYDARMDQLHEGWKPALEEAYDANDAIRMNALKQEYIKIGHRIIHEYCKLVETIIELKKEDLLNQQDPKIKQEKIDN